MLALVVAALTTGHKIGLALVGGAFIVFALISSFVMPRRDPNFPGKGLRWYVVLCFVFFFAMMAAVLVFGKEAPEAEGAREATSTTQPAETESNPKPKKPPAQLGELANGKKVFADAGCAGCHTLKDAGATGNVGPNLDDLKPDAATVERQVLSGGGAMPSFKGELSDKQVHDVAAYVASASHS